MRRGAERWSTRPAALGLGPRKGTKMPTGPLVSTMIVMHNGALTIAEAIESVRAQTLTDLECIVIDDGSTDTSPAIVRLLAEQDQRIRLITQEHRGVARARNRALDEARGTYLHFLDADDLIAPDALERLVAGAEGTPHGCAFGGWELIDDAGLPLGRQTPVGEPWVGLDELLDWNRLKTNAHLFSRRALGSVRFDETVEVAEDYDLVLRMGVTGVRWRGVDRVLAAYRVRSDGLSRRFADMARWHEWVLSWAFGEARARGWRHRGIDLTERRLARSIREGVLLQATMAALTDENGGAEAGVGVVRARGLETRFTSRELGLAACTGIAMGLGVAPVVESSEPSWLGALERWWRRCAREGWCDATDVDHAWTSLVTRSVHPDRIAERMVARGVGCERALVVGLGATGRRLVRHGVASGLRVLVFDDRSSTDEVALLDEPDVTISRDPAEAALWLARAGVAPVLVSDGFEQDALRVAGAADTDLDLVAWADTRSELADASVARAMSVLRTWRAAHRIGVA